MHGKWTADAKTSLVLQILAGERTVEQVADEHGLDPEVVAGWRDLYLAAARQTVRARRRQWMTGNKGHRIALTAIAFLAVVGFSGVVLSALANFPQCIRDGSCFQAKTPARASDMNDVLHQMVTWTETKIGDLDVSGVQTGNVMATGDITAVDVTAGGDLTATGDVGVGTGSPGADLHVRRNDSDIARIYAAGDSQGSGMIFVGQSPAFGGGISYDGNGIPDMVGDNDRVTFFRRNDSVDTDVFSYSYSSSTVRFDGILVQDDITVQGDIAAQGDVSIQGGLTLQGGITVDGNTVTGCRSGYSRFGNLCMSGVQGPTTWGAAAADCISEGAHICKFEEIYYRWNTMSDNPSLTNGEWLGQMSSDNYAFCVNSTTSSTDFDDTCNKGDSRSYHCCIGWGR